MMLAIFEGDGEVLICEVRAGEPFTGDYFKEDGRDKEDYGDMKLVEAPILITHGQMRVDSEREL